MPYAVHNQSFGEATSNLAAESSSVSRFGSSGVQRLRSCEKIFEKHISKAIKNTEKSKRRVYFFSPSGMIKTKIAIISAVASTAGASIEVLPR